MPAGFGAVGAIAYSLTAITSALVLGLVSGAMLFGHWYLIDLEMPVDYLRTFVRLLGIVLVADLVALGLAIAMPAMIGSSAAAAAVHDLFVSHLGLLAVRFVLGPVATIVLVWMCWQTLKIPQTMAATGLLYIAVMSVMVGEMLGRFILFRTAIHFEQTEPLSHACQKFRDLDCRLLRLLEPEAMSGGFENDHASRP